MESPRYDVAPYGIRTTVAEPGFFRTGLLVDASTAWPEPTIADYAERTGTAIAAWKNMSGRQPGDPVKLAKALLTIAGQAEPPLRFVVGADAVESVEAKAGELLAQARARASRQLGGDPTCDNADSAAQEPRSWSSASARLSAPSAETQLPQTEGPSPRTASESLPGSFPSSSAAQSLTQGTTTAPTFRTAAPTRSRGGCCGPP